MYKLYIGYDAREADAYRVCIRSLLAHKAATTPLSVFPINYRLLGTMYKRPTFRSELGLWDVISDAPMSTEFALARFYVPLLQRDGWAMFCDCDFMFRAPVSELFALADERYTVMVVKHEQAVKAETKMDGQIQTGYPRKNWSSLMLINCERWHRNAPEQGWPLFVNGARGLQLQQFAWLPDEEIGALPGAWNWLCTPEGRDDVSPQAVHFTHGVPSMRGYENYPYAEEWLAYRGVEVNSAAG